VIGTVYRAPKRDAHGDPMDESGNPVRLSGDGTTKVGTLSGLILGGQSVAAVGTRSDVASTEGLIGVPTAAAIRLQHGDVVALEDGTRYRITGPQLWGRPHSLTGTPARYAWWQATATVN
jgi:hypothetical protein